MKYSKLLTAAALTADLAMGATLPAQAADTNPNGTANHFDLQAHRGGIGMTIEATLEGFAKGLATGVKHPRTRPADHQGRTVVINHDRKISSTEVPGHRLRHGRATPSTRTSASTSRT